MNKIINKIILTCSVVVLLLLMPKMSVFAASYPHIDYSTKAGTYRVYQQRDADCAIASMASIEAYYQSSTSGAYDTVYSKNGYGVYINSWSALGYEKQSYSLTNLYNALKSGPCVIQRTGHFSVVVAYEGSTNTLEESGFKVMEIVGYYKYDGGYGHPSSWLTNYNDAIKVPLNVWGTYGGNSIQSISIRKAGVITTPLTSEFPLINNGIYKIRNVNSGKVLEVPGASTDGGVQLQQWDDIGASHQLWKAVKGVDGYSFVAVHSGKAMDLYGSTIEDGGKITHCGYHGGDNQRFKLVHRGEGRYSIHPVTSNLALDVYGYSTDNGALIYQYAYHGNTNQLFTFELADKEAPTITNVQITNVTRDGYTVSCEATDDIGVTHVAFPTWTEYNSQDDLANPWPSVANNGVNNTYTFRVNVSDHNYESGAYHTHIYAYDAAGNETCYGLCIDINRDIPLESFTLNQNTLKSYINQTQQLTVTSYTPTDTTSDKTATWQSSDNSIASVDGQGNVTGFKPGTATITCTIAGKTQTCTVTVLDAVLQEFTGWVESLPSEVSANSNLYEVQQKTQYRSSTKSETTSTDANLSGWTKSNEWWGDWQSCGSDVTGTDTREVKLEQQYVKTQYHYNHWHNGTYLSPVQYSGYVYHETGWLDSPLTEGGTSSAGGTKYKSSTSIGPCGTTTWWYNQTTQDVYNTLYYYRDKYFQYYQWSGWSDWSDNAVTASDTVNVETRTLYRYRYNGAQIVEQPVSQTIKEGETVTFAITASGSGLKYQWQESLDGGVTWKNAELTGSTITKLSVDGLVNRNGNRYRCVVTDVAGSNVASNAVTLTVIELLKIINQPLDTSAEVEETAKFTVEAKGDGLTYQWYFKLASQTDYTMWSGRTNPTLTFTVKKFYDDLLVYCVVTDVNGNQIETEKARLTVDSGLEITSHPATVSAEIGETAEYTVGANGNGLTYQWYYKRTDQTEYTKWSGKTKSALTFTVKNFYNDMLVYCVVTDANGNSVETQKATLEIEKALEITSHPEAVSAEVGETAEYTVGANGKGLTYQWYYKRTDQTEYTKWSGKTKSTLTFTVKSFYDDMLVYCVVTDANGNSVETQKATLEIEKALEITSHPEAVSAEVGETAEYTVGANGKGLTYQWYYKRTDQTEYTKWSGKTKPTLTFTVKSFYNDMLVYCVVTDANGNSVETEKATLEIKKVLEITSQPESTSAKIGEMVEYTVEASGDELTYQWYFKLASQTDYSMWGGRTKPTLTFAVKSFYDDLLVYCVITDANGNVVETEKAGLTAVIE